MKIKPEHYDLLKGICDATLNQYPNARKEYQDQGLSEERFRWDILWRALKDAGIRIGHAHNDDELPLYDYLNDDHIDTALRKIVGGFQLKQDKE